MDTNSKHESNKNTKKCLKSHLEDIRLEDNNKIERVLPWLPKFNKVVRSCTRSRNYEHLERLLFFYTQNILSSVAENTVKFNNKIDLVKNHINKMLIFFHVYWLDIKQQNVDYSQYLNKISALLNVYIDMELKTSSHVVKDSSKVAAKILAALYIYLNNSEEHIFRILLRNKHTTKEYPKVCNHIFMKSFTNLKTKTTSITDVAYIRYLLAFKMWTKMEETTKKLNLSDKKENINKLALMLLGPRMPKLQDELLKFVPKPPTGQENETLWLIQSNLFDVKQVHKRFLLFEDKMDNSTGLKCTKTIHADQNCSKSQKHQINSLFCPNDSNGGTSEQKINKCLGGLQNNNTLPNNKKNKNKCLETHLQKSGSKSLKSLKKRNKSRKIIIIDLTGDDEVKRKRTNRNSEFLKVIKNVRSKRHINSSKYSNKLTKPYVKGYSNEDNKNLEEKKESKPVVIKSNDSTENCTSVSNDICMKFTKEDEKQDSYDLRYLKSPMFDDQNINELKANVAKKSKLKNCVSSNMTIDKRDITNSCDNSITRNKGALTSQEKSAMETIPFKTCQNNVADQQNYQFDFKKELPTSTDCAIQKSCLCCNTRHVDHFIMTSLQFITDRSSLITEMIKQNVCQVNKCSKYCTNVIVAKAQGNLHNTFNDNENDIKLTCDTIRNDSNKYVYLLNHTDKCVTTVHAEKRVQCLDKIDDKCTVSTTFTEDQIVDPPSYNQHVNFGNFVKINDYESSMNSKHVNSDNRRKRVYENTMKERGKSDCDTLMFSDHRFDTNILEVDPKEISEVIKTNCINDFEDISEDISHFQTLEDLLSNNTTNFLSQEYLF